MKLLDVNILIYAISPRPEHAAVRTWFEDLMNSGERIALPWHSILGFLRVATQTTRQHPLAMAEALDIADNWLKWDNVWSPHPGPDHMRILSDLLREKALSRYVPDAHLAALAIEHGLTVCSTDSDFRGFGVKFLNPLE